jgi:TfoX/Sxy family transcriptional regulator of competence genes
VKLGGFGLDYRPAFGALLCLKRLKGKDMARDPGLEALLESDLKDVRGLSQKRMFGGLAWLLHGNLLIGARQNSLLVRLGKDRDAWALKKKGIEQMVMQGRRMSGWVRARAEAYGNDALRVKLIESAIEFSLTLPRK